MCNKNAQRLDSEFLDFLHQPLMPFCSKIQEDITTTIFFSPAHSAVCLVRTNCETATGSVTKLIPRSKNSDFSFAASSNPLSSKGAPSFGYKCLSCLPPTDFACLTSSIVLLICPLSHKMKTRYFKKRF